ncbi:unnamed protein product [Adineta steineri]|uniref:Uncharacterized protein n=1 Tax=Adineta steineri TaxID=433720 RepID=A0A815UEB0_9BILA|nr:unnamed protein product [Adineta steineri]CAF1517838.1 unnamed protein product [Adineta steineri]
MSLPLNPLTIIKLIQYGKERVETVTSNKEACALLVDDLDIIQGILNGLGPEEKTSADNYKLSRVMKKLHRITTRTNALFDKCASGKKWVKIRQFVCATSIKGELQKLHSEVPVTIGMLNLVFHIKRSAYTRGGTAIPTVDESIFNEEDEQDTEETEEYYVNDDTDE